MNWKQYYKKLNTLPYVDFPKFDKNSLFDQRKSFYNSICLNEKNFRNKTFMEIGPGSGYNAFYLLAQDIKKIYLVDINDEAIKSCKKKFKKKIKFIKKDVSRLNINKKFDYVIIENFIVVVDYPEKVLKKLLFYVKPNGYLIITTADEFSLFSDKLRGLIGHIVITQPNIIDKSYLFKRDLLCKIFNSHLKSLNLKTRKITSWVEDNVLSHKTATNKNYFPIDKITSILSSNSKLNEYVIWKSSPDFNVDFTWYKKRNIRLLNLIFKKNYLKNIINTIHHNEKFLNYQIRNYKKIIQNIKTINSKINAIKENNNLSPAQIKKIVYELKKLSKKFSFIKRKNAISNSLNEIILFLNFFIKKNKINTKYFRNFKNFWGNGHYSVAIFKSK